MPCALGFAAFLFDIIATELWLAETLVLSYEDELSSKFF
jgi:hypothetical protein